MKRNELIAVLMLMVLTLLLAAATKSRLAKENDKLPPQQRSIINRAR